MSKAVDEFCRMLRARSAEHRDAMALVVPHHLASVMVGLLRQELDSMVRVIYLLSTKSRTQRRQLIQASLDGKIWQLSDPRSGKKTKVTDRNMVDRATTLRNWAGSVYRFGCAFIHLSNFHDYRARDPFLALPKAEQREIIAHLRHYHGGPAADSPTFSDFVPYLPRVFEKVSSNLESYIVQLESNGDLEA